MSTPTPDRPTTTDSQTPARHRLYSILIGLAALAVLLQGLWAGIFLEHDGKRDAAAGWIDVHARGGEIAILLTARPSSPPSSSCASARSCGPAAPP